MNETSVRFCVSKTAENAHTCCMMTPTIDTQEGWNGRSNIANSGDGTYPLITPTFAYSLAPTASYSRDKILDMWRRRTCHAVDYDDGSKCLSIDKSTTLTQYTDWSDDDNNMITHYGESSCFSSLRLLSFSTFRSISLQLLLRLPLSCSFNAK